MKPNVKLFNKIKEKILEEPRRLDMANWIELYDESEREQNQNLPPCGTTACIAGWAHIISANSGDYFDFDSVIKALGFKDEDKYNLVNKLIYDDHWDKPYNSAYLFAETAQERANVAVNYINYFIQTYGDKVV